MKAYPPPPPHPHSYVKCFKVLLGPINIGQFDSFRQFDSFWGEKKRKKEWVLLILLSKNSKGTIRYSDDHRPPPPPPPAIVVDWWLCVPESLPSLTMCVCLNNLNPWQRFYIQCQLHYHHICLLFAFKQSESSTQIYIYINCIITMLVSLSNFSNCNPRHRFCLLNWDMLTVISLSTKTTKAENHNISDKQVHLNCTSNSEHQCVRWKIQKQKTTTSQQCTNS